LGSSGEPWGLFTRLECRCCDGGKAMTNAYMLIALIIAAGSCQKPGLITLRRDRGTSSQNWRRSMYRSFPSSPLGVKICREFVRVFWRPRKAKFPHDHPFAQREAVPSNPPGQWKSRRAVGTRIGTRWLCTAWDMTGRGQGLFETAPLDRSGTSPRADTGR